MTISVKPIFQSVIAEDPVDAAAGKVTTIRWNQGHKIEMATARLLGRITAGAGDAEEVSIGNGLALGSGALSADIASAAQYRSAVANKMLAADRVWAAAGHVALGNLSGTVNIDLSTGINFTGTFTGNVTLGTVTGGKAGQCGIFEFNENATGGYTLSVNVTYWARDNGAVPAIATAANAKNRLAYYVQADGKVLLTPAAKAVS